MNIDFEELSHDVDIISKLQQFSETAFQIQDMVELVNNVSLYDKLSNADKIKYNLLLSYSLNSLFWMYLRAEGVDPLKHRIKSENERLQNIMTQAKQISDRNIPTPRIDKNAAKRFIRSGLWQPKQIEHKDMEKKLQE